MADREDQPPVPPGAAAGGLSAEEADRLSERFRPSWDADAKPAPARAPAKQTLIGGIAPASPSRPPPPRPSSQPPAAANGATPGGGATTPSSPPAASASGRPPAKHTLIGLAPASASEPPARPAPPAPSPSTPAPAVVTAGGGGDGPSGIAKVYKPKDDPAVPPVVLTEELQQTEAAANAEREARRRAQSSLRHMQTVMNIKAPDFSGVAPPKRRRGWWQLAIGVVAGIIVVGAVFKLTEDDPRAAEAAATAAPSPPSPPAAAQPETPPEVTPGAPEVLPAAPPSGDSADPAAATAPATTVATPAPKKPAPKTAKPTAKDSASAPRSPSSPAKKGEVIVRDTPF